jgi:site-specific recombinase XerD
MSLPIKLVCKKNKARKDGTCIIFIQYCQSSDKRILLNSGVAIPPNYWNKKSNSISKELPSQYGNVDELQNVLIRQLRKTEDILILSKQDKNKSPIDFLKKNFYLDNPIQTLSKINEDFNNLDVYKNFDSFIESKRLLINHRSLYAYYGVKKHLQAFEHYRKLPITFDSFDANFFESFATFLTYEINHCVKNNTIKGFKKNTVAKTLKKLKTFLRDRMRKKLIPYIDLSFYNVEEEEVENISLTTYEISKIYHLDLQQNPYLEKYRDLFVLGCLTGLRFSDYSKITADDIKDEMLYIRQTKTSSPVIIPLRFETKTILEKYQLQIPFVTNQKLNFYIKKIAQIAGVSELVKMSYKKGNKIFEEVKPKCEWITSHTCRRSFCTNEFLAGTPTELIMAISGHKTESSFKKYVKADQFQKAQLIKKIWEEREML